jgi:hypothetical protein
MDVRVLDIRSTPLNPANNLDGNSIQGAVRSIETGPRNLVIPALTGVNEGFPRLTTAHQQWPFLRVESVRNGISTNRDEGNPMVR